LRARLTVLGERSPARAPLEPEVRWPAPERRARVAEPLICVLSPLPELAVAFASSLLEALCARTSGVVALLAQDGGGVPAGAATALRAAGAERVALLSGGELGLAAEFALPRAASGPARVGVGLGWALAAGVQASLCIYVEPRAAALAPRERAWAATLRSNAQLQVAAPGSAVARMLGDWLGDRVATRADALRGEG
jgi:hypothetical protein